MSEYTDIKFGKEARDALMRGAKQLYDTVSISLGPRGRNVVINRNFDIDVLHDGVKISRFVVPEDKFEKTGSDLVREAAEQQVSRIGDGTTLVTVLAYHIAREALTLIDSGINAMSLRQSLEKGRDILIDEINRLSKKIKTEKEKIQVAIVASGDEQLGEMIGKTYHKIGADGIITADESKLNETKLEHQEGITIDHGYMSPYFITDGRTLTATIRKAWILFVERDLDDVYEIVEFVDSQMKPKKERNLVIIAKSVTGAALASLIETKRRGLMNILCVKTPSFGKYQREMLDDIAIMCGGTVNSEVSQKTLKDIDFKYLGYADIVKSSRDSTTIIGNKGNKKEIVDRIASIRKLLKEADTDLDQEKLKERLSKMTGGVYVIKTGGATEIEMKERRERVDDAIKATKAAIQSGIVPGGEVTFLTAGKKLTAKNTDEEYAFRILKDAIEKPFEKLLSNAGLDKGYFKAKLESLDYGFGVNVNTGVVENLIDTGIVDPAVVLTEAIRSAVSVAVLLITSDAVSVIVKDEEK